MNVIQRDKVIAFLTSILVFSLVIFGLVNSSLASSTVKNAKMPLPPLRKLKQLLQNPSFEHTWRPKGSSDDEGSSFTLSGTNLDNWQSFRVGHAPLAKPFVSHSGNVALRMDRSGEGLGVMQHVEIRSEKPAKVILQK